jgi:hypothetical protein
VVLFNNLTKNGKRNKDTKHGKEYNEDERRRRRRRKRKDTAEEQAVHLSEASPSRF